MGASIYLQRFYLVERGPKAFKKHQGSDCHHEAVNALVVLPQCTTDVGELRSKEHEVEKVRNSKMYWLVLQNIQFLARQGLAPERR